MIRMHVGDVFIRLGVNTVLSAGYILYVCVGKDKHWLCCFFLEFPKSKLSEAKLIAKIILRETDVTESLKVQLFTVDVLCVGHSVSFLF